MTNAITVHDLKRSYGSTHALNGLNLTAPQGQITGFLGPNGAGKSTTMHILLGMLRADSGHVSVLGQDPWKNSIELHRHMAYVPGDVALWPNLTGGESIGLLTRLRGSSKATHSEIARLEQAFELDPTKKTRTYSKGNRQKVALVAALASDVDLYLFDEPTSGLDPLMAAVFISEVRRLRAAGKSVLLCSHILAEVQELCDTLTMISQGRDVETGTLKDLRHLGHVRITVTPKTDLNTLKSQLEQHLGIPQVVLSAGQLTFSVDNTSLDTVLSKIASAGVQSLTVEPPSLEELFLRRYHDADSNRLSEREEVRR